MTGTKVIMDDLTVPQKVSATQEITATTNDRDDLRE